MAASERPDCHGESCCGLPVQQLAPIVLPSVPQNANTLPQATLREKARLISKG